MAETVIGKNIIENLTTAMYEDQRIVYREYIQNAADSIDKAIDEEVVAKDDAEISIVIDRVARKVTIRDNGTGILQKDFDRIMRSVAVSTKNRAENKGFRGIGRLGGVSSCDQLRFSTTALGETCISIFEWDAKQTREILNDPSRNPTAAELVDQVTEHIVCEDAADEDDHFFQVELIDVVNSSEILLEVETIAAYLREVAPVPYDLGFTLGKKIEEYAKQNNFRIDSYRIILNGDVLRKPYHMELYQPSGKDGLVVPYDRLNDIEFRQFKTPRGHVMAWMWFGICGFKRQIPSVNQMRGIRIRKGNIQIGDRQTLTNRDMFKENRGADYFVGEIFVEHSGLVPNARRDYFSTDPACMKFESLIKPMLYEELCGLYRAASDIKKGLEHRHAYEESLEIHNEKARRQQFVNQEAEDKSWEEVQKKREKAEAGMKKAQSAKKKADEDESGVMSKVVSSLESEYGSSAPSSSVKASQVKQKGVRVQKLAKLTSKEKALVSRIYAVVNAFLDPDTSEELIGEIEKELSK